MDAVQLETFREFMPLAWKIAREQWHPVNANTGELLGMSLDDMRQVASLALFRAILTYDPNYGPPLGAYLAVKIRQRCIDVLRKLYGLRGTRKRMFQFSTAPKRPTPGYDDYARSRNSVMFREEPHHHEIDTDEVLEKLPPRLKRLIVLYYLEGLTMAQVGKELGVKKARVCDMHKEALRIMRQRLAA